MSSICIVNWCLSNVVLFSATFWICSVTPEVCTVQETRWEPNTFFWALAKHKTFTDPNLPSNSKTHGYWKERLTLWHINVYRHEFFKKGAYEIQYSPMFLHWQHLVGFLPLKIILVLVPAHRQWEAKTLNLLLTRKKIDSPGCSYTIYEK